MALPLIETRIAGDTGHIADHNTLHDVANRLDLYPVNVKEYGFLGNGTAADLDRFQSAVAAAIAASKPLYIPAGTWTITFSAADALVNLTGSIDIIGAGKKQTIINVGPEPTTFGFEFLSVQSGAHVTVRGMTINGPATTNGITDQVTYGFRIYGPAAGTTQSVRFFDVDIQRKFRVAVAMDAGAGNLTGTTSLEAYNCDFTAAQQCWSLFGTDTAIKSVNLVDCQFHDAGFSAAQGGPSGHLFYIHPHIAANLVRCTFYNATATRWAWHQFSGSGTQITVPKHLRFTDCTFYNTAPIITSEKSRTTFKGCVFLQPSNALQLNHGADIIGCTFRPTGDAGAGTIGLVGTYTEFPTTGATVLVSGSMIDLSSVTNALSIEVSTADKANMKLLLRGNTFRTTVGQTAAVQATISTAFVEVTDSDFYGPTASGNGIYINGGTGTIRVSGVRVNGRTKPEGFIDAATVGTNLVRASVEDCDFSGMLTGGAVYSNGALAAGKMKMSRCRFASATGGVGRPRFVAAAGTYGALELLNDVGANLASAATLNIVDMNANTFHVTGTTAIDTIKYDNTDERQRGAHGATIKLIADGAWSTSTAGNIKPNSVVARAVNAVVTLTYDAITGFWYEGSDVSGGGGGSGVGPLFFGGYYYAAPATISTFLMVNDRMYATPFEVGENVTMDRIGVTVTTLGSAGSVTRLGIYSDDGSGRPGALLLDAGTVDTTTTGDKEATISQALTAGWYWLVADSQGAPTTAPTVRSNNSSLLPIGALSGTGISANNTAGYFHSSVTGAFPTPFVVGGTASNAPRVYVRAV